MPNANTQSLDALARRAALETFAIESSPAFFEQPRAGRLTGHAAVFVSRSSIEIRFTADANLTVDKAAYGAANGRIGAINGAWLAPRVNDAGVAASQERLFGASELIVPQNAGPDIAATRLVFAGAAWDGSGLLAGRPIVVAPLSKDVVSHHEARFSVTVDDALDAATIEAIDRASSFVAGLDLELLRVDSFSAQGDQICARHLRGFRRVGRGPHSPFTGIADTYRMQAWTAVAQAIPRLEKDGVPIIMMINYIASHNQVAEINAGTSRLLLTTQMAAYLRVHGSEVGAGAASRRPEMALLNRELNLGLNDADLDRFEKLRVELLEAGFFHKPGYETGRPQKDVKFLRDIAHLTIFRLCGYEGPFYGAETFTTRHTPAGGP